MASTGLLGPDLVIVIIVIVFIVNISVFTLNTHHVRVVGSYAVKLSQ